MIKDQRFIITVPASSANLGPGFDSVGIALSRYLSLKVELAEKWEFIPKTKDVEEIPTNEENLMYQVAAQVAEKYEVPLPPAKVEVESDIPLTRGLGSSASAIVAGIELANELCGLQLTIEEKLRTASLIEGHPDNVGPSLYGGLIIGNHHEKSTQVVHLSDIDLEIVAVIPRYELRTSEARSVLPKELSYRTAVEASAVSNVLVAALMSRNWQLAGEMMERDLFHEPYRASLVPELEVVRLEAKKKGALGTALSGAGPTILCLAQKGTGKDIAGHLQHLLPSCDVSLLHVDQHGVQTTRETVKNHCL
ncbi:homoserine kinase [Bacillus songklensis]|uniref:Homoserine kinase n=1 Tax=Bacillus songklensis TaxID=1069116 RepID=A0ABV8B8N9_9BACI